ncbi:MAG: ABC transporter substrate-binding protein [Tissierellia bacterium]|nr:ABC transporter substrate-binding protein [Tissierellia bacterium]
MKKSMKLMALLLSLMMVLVACGKKDNNDSNNSKGADTDIIHIGGLAPLTGNVSIYGVSADKGAQLAFKEINEAGGILDKQVKYEVLDEQGDANEAVNAYNKLVSEGIVALVGDITSGPTEAVAALSVDDNMPMITPTGTQFSLTEGRPNVFRICYTDPYQGEILAQYVADDLGLEKVAIMKNNSSDYSQGVADTFEEHAKGFGLDVVAVESYGETDNDFRVQLTNMVSKNPDAILISDYYEKAAIIASQAREVGLESLFLGPDGWDGVLEQIDEASLDVVAGAVFANHYSMDDPSDKIQNFLQAYRDEYGENPSAFSALAYDAAYLYKEAMEKAGSTDGQAIVDAIKAIEFDGITGKFTYDDNNNPVKAVSIIKIVDGEYRLDTVVEPK